MLAAAQGWGGESGPPAPGPGVLGLPGARRAARVPARGDRPRHGAAGARSRASDAWVVGPLGIGFRDPPPEGSRALLVGGGIGIAPLVIWAEALRARGTPARSLLGFRSGAYAAAAGLFAGRRAGRDRRRHRPGRPPRARHGPAGAASSAAATRSMRAGRRRCSRRCGGSAPRVGARRSSRWRPAWPAASAPASAAWCDTRTGYRRLCVDGPVVTAADLDEGWE